MTTWVDWVTVGSACATLVGVWIGVGQLRRQVTVSTATRQAVDRALRQIAGIQLALLIPRLQAIEEALDEAAANNAGDEARRLLVEWRTLAGDARGLLDGANVGSAHREFLRSLQESATLASRAKSVILEGKRSVLDSTKQVRAAVAHVCEEAGRMSSRMMMEAGAGDGN